MIIYISMIFWVLAIYGLYSITHRKKSNIDGIDIDGKEKNMMVPLGYALLTFAYIIFWIGMRRYVADTTQYIRGFNSLPNNIFTGLSQIDWEGKSPGWDTFNVLFKGLISEDYTLWLMTIAIISGVCIMVTLRKYSCNFFYSAYMFVVLNTFVWMMNGMRQFVCVSILFACCDLIKNGKFIKFVLLVLLLSTVHMTVLLMIPIYFVVRCKPWSTRIFFFIVAIIVICLFIEPFFAGLEDTVLSDTAYSGATSQFESDDGVNPLRVLFFSLFPILALWKNSKLKEHFEDEPMLAISLNMSLITTALYLVGMFTSGILIGRLPIYTSVYNMLLIPYIFKYALDEKDGTIVKFVVNLAFLVMFWMECPEYYHSDLTGAIN